MATAASVLANRYELGGEIGRGGMARVYVAHDRLLERTVAVKVLSELDAHDDTAIERFRREAQAAARLNHPNIVGVYDWGEEADTAFIVMEYVDGQTLREVIDQYGRLTELEAARVAADIADALAFAHRNGVVHRDVKPGNVLITPDGQVKVTDFGIARAEASEALTKTGAVMGTATYFSPEQAQGLVLDGRSDVYSVGVVLYEMVTGEAPFTAETPVTVAYMHVREELQPPSSRVPTVSGAMDRLVLTAMTKDVSMRYQSADELRADLLRFERGRPLLGGPVTAMVAEVPTHITVDAPFDGGGRAAPTAAVPRLAPEPAPVSTQSRGRHWAAIVSIAAALALLLAFIIVLLANSDLGDDDSGPPLVVVPNVVNVPFADAEAQLDALGFAVDREDTESVGQPADLVLGQSPERDRKADKGSTVTLTVSSAFLTLPDVVGKSRAEADAIMRGKGIAMQVQEIDSDQPVGTVLLMYPPAGTPIPKADPRVGVQVAKEPAVPVPDVTGQDQTTAAATIGAAGFSVKAQQAPSDSVPVGRVIRTDPPVGTPLPKGSEVTLVVSSGPDLVEVFSVIGQDEASGVGALTGAGFNVAISYRTVAPPDRGKIVAQSPTSGRLPSLSTVTVVVGN